MFPILFITIYSMNTIQLFRLSLILVVTVSIQGRTLDPKEMNKLLREYNEAYYGHKYEIRV